MQGPSVKKLICRKMAQLMIPDGGGFADGLRELSDPSNIANRAREATSWVQQAINLVKSAPDNPYGGDDELIAGEILRQIEQRQAAKRAET
jgi:hypothetical protein